MARHVVSRIVRGFTNSCSGFGHYFMNVQSSNCRGCPDCRCEDGPSIEDAKRHYRTMLRTFPAELS